MSQKSGPFDSSSAMFFIVTVYHSHFSLHPTVNLSSGPRLLVWASEPFASFSSQLSNTLLGPSFLKSFPKAVPWSLFLGFPLLGLSIFVPVSGGHLSKAFKAFFLTPFLQALPHSTGSGFGSNDGGSGDPTCLKHELYIT